MAEQDNPKDGSIESYVPEARSDLPIYTAQGIDREFRQAEIITDLAQHTYNGSSKDVEEQSHRYAIVLTQDCDLLWDYEARSSGKASTLNGVLIYELESAASMRPKVPPGRDIWKRIIQNQDERYHYLGVVSPSSDLLGQGMPDMILDFKRHFTISPQELQRQCIQTGTAKRRCRLESPYREHLQSRAGFYFQRVMIPEPHGSAAKNTPIALPSPEHP